MSGTVATPAIAWPPKYDVMGVRVSATTYDEACRAIVESALARLGAIVSAHAVHAVVTASDDDALRDAVNSFDIITPDGQPVRWALNRLHGAELGERVYGPELMLRVCRQAAEEGVSVFLYGGASDALVTELAHRLVDRIPQLEIAGTYSPPFRDLTPEEDDEVVRSICDSGAGIVFIGLGCPKQDWFAFHHRDRISAVQICVGAAFDFHAGQKAMAPEWMQRRGLEWLYRLAQEPQRLWRRYLVTNTKFVLGTTRQWGRMRLSGGR